MDISLFRANFPEFSDTAKYPDAQITFWASVAEAQVIKARWGDVYVQGVNLYVAHEISISAQNKSTSVVGGQPGITGGVPNNKTVGQVSVAFDSQVSSEKDAGWWNRTTYGMQFIRLARLFGAGAIVPC